MPDTCQLEVTTQERELLLLLRQQKWCRIVLHYQNGRLTGPIEKQETIKLGTEAK